MEIVGYILLIGGGIAIVGGLGGQFYFHYVAMKCRRELWRREDARAAGTVPYDADGYEDWALPIPSSPNTRRYVEKKERPAPSRGNRRNEG